MSCGRHLINLADLQRIINAFAAAAATAEPHPSSAASAPRRKRPRVLAAMTPAAAPPPEAEEGETMILTEHVDMTVVEYIAANPELIKSVNDRAKFVRYVEWARASNGRIPITYRQRGGLKRHGRWHADHASSMQGLKEELSNTLALRYYVQIDMRNTHLVLLLELAHRYKLTVPALTRYVAERETVLEEIVPGNREAAKNLMLIATYNGSLYGGSRKHGLSRVPPMVRAFGADCRRVERRVFVDNPAIVSGLVAAGEDGAARNFAASVIAAVLQQMESDVLMAALTFLRERGWEVGALKHDGVLIHRREDGSGPDAALVEALSVHVAAVCNLHDVVFLVKPLDEKLLELPPALMAVARPPPTAQ